VIHSSKLWDAGQKYFSFTAHVYSPSPLLMSKKKFDASAQGRPGAVSEDGLEVASFSVNSTATPKKPK